MILRNRITLSFCLLTALALPVGVYASTPEEDVQTLIQQLPALKPITYQASDEKYHIVVFIENQCGYCADVLKNIKKYTDAVLTMSFLTAAPKSIRDSVIEDMSRVWCAPDPARSLQNTMKVFLPDNDSTPKCVHLIEQQSALSDRLGIQATPVMVVLKAPPTVFLGNAKPENILRMQLGSGVKQQ
ncbi:thioredoxin fold domain-containing protein (plasmid) [Klebsiella sp. B345]|uniref:thioredoxin fold domain-containing protein n=1 Tax=Klebsiella sp. B345 TaxID=2755398 RepID=UPI003DA8BEEC